MPVSMTGSADADHRYYFLTGSTLQETIGNITQSFRTAQTASVYLNSADTPGLFEDTFVLTADTGSTSQSLLISIMDTTVNDPAFYNNVSVRTGIMGGSSVIAVTISGEYT